MPRKTKTPTSDQLQDWASRPAARRRSEVPEDMRHALAQGWIASKNLVEWLSVDRPTLASVTAASLNLPLTSADRQHIRDASSLSALQQSWSICRSLAEHVRVGSPEYLAMAGHASDVVREWSAILVGLAPNMTFAKRLAWIKTQADDEHAGVRELAWLALRAHVLENPVACIASLVPWTGSRHERLRRYASEITRPCGVWCPHIGLLKQEPELAIAILEPLRADDSRYVNNSVANWLNDASKSQPDWVRQLTQTWLRESPSPHTQRIVTRGLRTINR